VRKQGEISVQEAEIQRSEKELIATVLRAAEVERQRIETLAEAERQRRILQATGQAESVRLEGQAQAEVTRNVGTAEAEVILAKGQAEANAMQVKAGAYQNYNQAAVLDKLLSGMPEVVRALSEPLGKVDKITVVSTGGDGGGTGVNRVTADLSTMVAQVPALLETLTGMTVADLLARVPELGASTNGAGTANGATTTQPVGADGARANGTHARAAGGSIEPLDSGEGSGGH
jgi:flotillin